MCAHHIMTSSTTSIECWWSSPHNAWTLKKKWMHLLSCRAFHRVGRSSIWTLTMMNNINNLTLDEIVKHILLEDFWRKSMGLIVDENVEAHFYRESTLRINQDWGKSKGRRDQQRSMSRGLNPNAFCIYSKNVKLPTFRLLVMSQEKQREEG